MIFNKKLITHRMETTFNGFTAEFMEQVKEIKGVRKEQSKEEKRAGFELRMRRKDERTNRERPSTHQQVEKHLKKRPPAIRRRQR